MNKIDRGRWEEALRKIGISRFPDRLTDGIVKAATATEHATGERYQLADGNVPGMVLLVGATGGGTYFLFYRTHEGLRRQYKIGGAAGLTLDAARVKARATIARVESGGDPADEEREARKRAITLREYIAGAYSAVIATWVTREGYAKASYHYQHRIEKVWKEVLATPLDRITGAMIEKTLAARRLDGYAGGTLRRDWSILRGTLRHAVKHGHLAQLPMVSMPEALRGTTETKRVRYLGQMDTEEEIASGRGERVRFAEALAAFESSRQWGGDFMRTMVKIAMATGMRRTEILRLKIQMVDWRKETITLPAELTKAKKERVVNLNADALKAIRDWPHRLIDGTLFPGPLWTHWTRMATYEMPELCREAKIKDFHFHDLRHDFASRLAMAGAPLLAIKDALGHASLQMTERYAHLAPSVTREAVQALSR